MKTFTIGWLNKCRCGNKLHSVKTARGNDTGLWDDDAVKCNSCGRGGVIQVCEGQARVLWETDEEMTENKPMSTITKQWLQQKIAEMEATRDEIPFGLGEDGTNTLAALRIALASLEAEPSYFVNRVKHSDAYGEDVELRTYCYELDALKSKDDFGGEIVPVYTVQPAPFSLPVQHWEELCRQNPDMSIGDAIIRAAWWNHCAAMLQGVENAETPTTMQTAPALDSSPKIAESPSGNSPVIPDGWVACSERMPKKGDEVLCTDQFENYETALYDTGYIPGPPFFATTAGEFHPTHWMPLPAAPQQEVK
ncbi:DUF551 domain-containing protein [Enterobacter kobei]|uniref:DUF551 domain-containing protein n=1 Tax=Enterobacter kobei TaxID=208224 RepID=UPI003F556FD7